MIYVHEVAVVMYVGVANIIVGEVNGTIIEVGVACKYRTEEGVSIDLRLQSVITWDEIITVNYNINNYPPTHISCTVVVYPFLSMTIDSVRTPYDIT